MSSLLVLVGCCGLCLHTTCDTWPAAQGSEWMLALKVRPSPGLSATCSAPSLVASFVFHLRKEQNIGLFLW